MRGALQKSFFLFWTLLFHMHVWALEYFNSPIDYWKSKDQKTKSSLQANLKEAGEEKSIEKTKDKNKDKEQKITEAQPQKSLVDKPYLDPRDPSYYEFGKVPPKVFREALSQPTMKNIRLWHEYNKKRSRDLARFLEANRRYLKKLTKTAPARVQQAAFFGLDQATPPSQPLDRERFAFRLFFDSDCPHCKKMLSTMRDLKSMGYFVEILKIDAKPFLMPFGFVPKTPSRRDLSRYENEKVPLLLVADLKTKNLLPRIRGYRTTSEILNVLHLAKLRPHGN